ncbi:hypothetical protein NMY22_g3112 [Coprinellus aureogranulatus]|nr:hypothetical protein NMY22_g3112 [Coprinellus aureogranulatus]
MAAMFSPQTQILLNTTRALDAQLHHKKLIIRIQELKDEIKALESSCNALSPPNRIPPEILSRIFLIVQWRSRARGPGRPGNLAWIRVTHVCRHWRDTALECTTLWTNLSLINPAFTAVMLQRSKNAPLTVECTLHRGPVFQEILQEALSRPRRLKSVTLFSSRIINKLDATAALSQFSGSAPMLEVLDLCADEETAIGLPEKFLEDGGPSLRKLSRQRCLIPSWESLPLSSSLTCVHLEVLTESGSAFFCPSWGALLGALEQMSLLEDLDLTGFLPKVDEATVAPWVRTLPLTLQALRNLSLDDSFSSVQTFFRCYRIPNVTRVDITFRGTSGTNFLQEFMPQLATSRTGRSHMPAKRLEIHGAREIKGPGFNFTFDDLNQDRLSLRFADSTLTSNDVLPELAPHMGFSRLWYLILSSESSLTTDTILTTFGVLKRLRAVLLSPGSLTEDFIGALAVQQSAGRGRFHFPALRDLDFQDEDFAAMFTQGDALSCLISALDSRPHSCPTLDINIYESDVNDKEHSRRLARALPRVKVRYHPDNYLVPFFDFDTDSDEEEEAEDTSVLITGESEEEDEESQNGSDGEDDEGGSDDDDGTEEDEQNSSGDSEGDEVASQSEESDQDEESDGGYHI